MKQYHTSINIQASRATVWQALMDFDSYPQWNPIVGALKGELKVGATIATSIVPLSKTYYPTVLVYEPEKELTWQGVQGAAWLLAGKHYYRLEELSPTQTRLLHGEYFTGMFSHFIKPSLLRKMENAFVQHNQILKQRIEDGTK